MSMLGTSSNVPYFWELLEKCMNLYIIHLAHIRIKMWQTQLFQLLHLSVQFSEES